jgi:hypothetical protein
VPDVEGPPSPSWRFCLTTSTTTPPSSPIFTLLKNANCRLGPGTAYDSVDVLLQGVSVTIEGRNEDNFWFWVQKPSGRSQCWVSASVGTASGIWEVVPIIAAPPLPITATPAPPLPITVTPNPVDLTPPEISDMTANPALISVQTQCGATPPTTIINARVTDDGGITRVVARVAGFGEFDMAPAGGGYYQATLGPFGEAGMLTIFVHAQDTTGNSATSAPITVQVVACPG